MDFIQLMLNVEAEEDIESDDDGENRRLVPADRTNKTLSMKVYI